MSRVLCRGMPGGLRLPSQLRLSLQTYTRHRCLHQSRIRQNVSPTPPQAPKVSTGKAFGRYSAAAVLSLAAYALGSLYPPDMATLLFPRAAAPPIDPLSEEAHAYTAALEKEMMSLPILKEHRNRQDADDWYEIRPFRNYPEERRVNHLTSGALRAPGKLALAPICRVKKDESEAFLILHVGRGLCGHDGIVHGGLLATLLDESMGRTAIVNLPDKVGVTAYLNLKYRAPTRADQFIVIKTHVDKVEGRKALVSGRIEDPKGTLLVEADALFIQPRYANLLNNQNLKLLLAVPEASSKHDSKTKTPIHLADGEKLTK